MSAYTSLKKFTSLFITLFLLSQSLLFGTTAAEEPASATTNWNKVWEIDLEKAIGLQKYPVDLYRGDDGNVYITNRPEKETEQKLIAVTPDGKVKWKYTLATKNKLSIPIDNVDKNGNVYIQYFTNNHKLMIHKIGPNGKLISKYTLPGTFVRETLSMSSEEVKKLATYQITYHDDNTFHIVRADGTTGMLDFYLMNEQGKIVWKKQIKQQYKVNNIHRDIVIQNQYVIVHQAKYVDVYDLKGNKKFRITKSTTETIDFQGVHEQNLIGQRFILNNQGYTSMKHFSIGANGKTNWMTNQTTNTLLYNWGGSFIASNNSSLMKLDPVSGKMSVLLEDKSVRIEKLVDSYRNLTLRVGVSSANSSNYKSILLDPTSTSPTAIDFYSEVAPLLPSETRNGTQASTDGRLFQKEQQVDLYVWNNFQIAFYTRSL